MWQGLANCYTKLARRTDAIKAYKRAVIGGSTDLSILVTLASLLEQEGDIKAAASFQHQIISETTVPGTGELTSMAAKAHLWLARMEISNGDLDAAERHVNEALKGHYVRLFCVRTSVLTVGIRGSTSVAEGDKGVRGARRSINDNSQCINRHYFVTPTGCRYTSQLQFFFATEQTNTTMQLSISIIQAIQFD